MRPARDHTTCSAVHPIGHTDLFTRRWAQRACRDVHGVSSAGPPWRHRPSGRAAKEGHWARPVSACGVREMPPAMHMFLVAGRKLHQRLSIALVSVHTMLCPPFVESYPRRPHLD
ncbi:uncharacterized protein TRAVEDRAFT_28901, partial [Trametes versicolor FP-101664 SS1]|uniref:uncharacterized protein n=1 Tax=Trametes versicolor (strain FP-101664) TaxID=717944 RepID=UPI0004621261